MNKYLVIYPDYEYEVREANEIAEVVMDEFVSDDIDLKIGRVIDLLYFIYEKNDSDVINEIATHIYNHGHNNGEVFYGTVIIALVGEDDMEGEALGIDDDILEVLEGYCRMISIARPTEKREK